ncbi:decaprenyl-phosphate phosphoribosyltransferase [Leptolinea tardivitalis]|uniref:Phosphoribose diphosphate:decaprenyl-phosphate phosphoribosyltransferase n=1 Tax=Leptolinea tardivitalis TaxID=229920 RepID=A0A0P6WPD3_9CHLR|nr:decaprenyl-phosphate phosphoribosyltransferase [Leptolinea tardivitalis]KPL71917.1 phosphoribose diphosphate:decaprenyl-phosphate phosphoribosyltransferase [Leptolinea tardivitalis]GAP20330.1 4-hydroxybenzoate polyprenyltransferase [Leptolinea tardivitalis]
MLRAIIKTMRVKQWTKNAIVFAALVFDRQLTNPVAFGRTLAGFFLFCILSSTVYIINDIMDVEADRQHPKKKYRPIASGQLPIPVAIGIAAFLLIIAFPISYVLSPYFCIVAAAYFIINLAYSIRLKHIVLVDVLILSMGFVLRVGAGVSLIHVERFSPWLYVVTYLLALYLGFGKRRAELTLLSATASSHRKVLDGYTIPFLDQVIMMISGMTIISYSLYTFSAPNLPTNHAMMLTIPFVLYGLLRYLYIVEIEGTGNAPDEILLIDRPLQIAILLWGICVLAIFYLF